jgi:putative glycosyltransferase (TIGR04372 family)
MTSGHKLKRTKSPIDVVIAYLKRIQALLLFLHLKTLQRMRRGLGIQISLNRPQIVPDSDTLQSLAPRSMSVEPAELARRLGLSADDPRLPFALLAQIMRQTVKMRFVPLRFADVIGEFALDTELYLCEKEAGLRPSDAVDIFFHSFHLTPNFCNLQLKEMWERIVPVWPIKQDLIEVLTRLPGGSDWTVNTPNPRDHHGILLNSRPHLKFLPAEIQQGKSTLERMGIPQGSPYVCFHARDSNYDTSMNRYSRDFTNYRDSNICQMLPAAEALANLGYYVVRVGKIQSTPIRTLNPKIIDYTASEFRSDFMDVYLLANCSFFFGGDAGIYAIAEAFRRPYAFVNFPGLHAVHIWNPSPFIPKHFCSISKRVPITFSEALRLEADGFYLDDSKYAKAGIELIENTPEEILDLVLETEARLKGTWRDDERDDILQNRFWDIYKSQVGSAAGKVFRTRIGTKFLRQNPEWLQ